MSQPVRITRFTVIILPTLYSSGDGEPRGDAVPLFPFRMRRGAPCAREIPDSCHLPGIQILLMSRRRREHRTLREA